MFGGFNETLLSGEGAGSTDKHPETKIEDWHTDDPHDGVVFEGC